MLGTVITTEEYKKEVERKTKPVAEAENKRKKRKNINHIKIRKWPSNRHCNK